MMEKDSRKKNNVPEKKSRKSRIVITVMVLLLVVLIGALLFGIIGYKSYIRQRKNGRKIL